MRATSETLWWDTYVYPNNIPGQLSNVLQDTCTSHNLKFIEDCERWYAAYLRAKKNLDLHFPVCMINLQASWSLIAAPYLHRCRRCLLLLRNKLLSGLSAHCGFTAGAVRCWHFLPLIRLYRLSNGRRRRQQQITEWRRVRSDLNRSTHSLL